MGVDYVIYEKTDPVVDDDAYYGEFLNEYRDVDGILPLRICSPPSISKEQVGGAFAFRRM